MKLSGNTLLIIGGTSGIGRALAERFHRLGNQVIIVGRRQHLLDEITAAHSGMYGIAFDINDRGALRSFAREVVERFPKLNVLINNAGIMRTEDLVGDPADLGSARAILDTNILGVLETTAAFLPTLKRQPSATILTTSSGLAFVPLASNPTYSASKAFLHSWLQSLRFQLRETAIEVLELVPPYVQTELGGPSQAIDPNAMPLADYTDEVMQILSEPELPQGEILVERVKALRWAEKNGDSERMFALVNGH